VELPPLADTDALVRRLVGELSSHPRVAAWLATDGLIRSFTVAVQNVAEGQVPARALRVLRPTGQFTVIETGSDLRIDPRSYARYDGLADAVNSVDAAGAARLYSLLKPRIEEAYAELGNDVPFDRTLERAIVMLLRAPVLEGSVPLDPSGGVFAFENQNVERMTAAQKQLTRMGPRNARLIQQTLRAIALPLRLLGSHHARADRGHDRQRQDRPRPVHARGGRDRRDPGHRDRSQGRHGQPAARLSGTAP
jgi:hypothetical protein